MRQNVAESVAPETIQPSLRYARPRMLGIEVHRLLRRQLSSQYWGIDGADTISDRLYVPNREVDGYETVEAHAACVQMSQAAD